MLQLGTASFWLLDCTHIFSVYKDEKSSPDVEAFWISDTIYLTKLNYAKSALDKTVEEAKEIRTIVFDETISILRDGPGKRTKTEDDEYHDDDESERVPDSDSESNEKPRKRTETEDDEYHDDESESDESDDECELRLSVEEMGFDEYVDRNDQPFIFKTKNIPSLFESYRSKALAHAQNSGLIMTKNYHEILETLEDLRKDIKSKLIGKEKVTRDVKSILQEYIEIALDDNDGGLHELRETITESFSKKFNSTAEKEFLRRMKFLFEHLSLYYPITSIERNYKRRDTCGEYNKSGVTNFFHDSYIYPTICPNTSSTSAKVRKLAIGDPSRAKQLDMIGKIVNNGKFVYESMFGEVTGEGKNNTEKKNLIDLVRLGIFMKDSLDNISRKTGVNRIFGWQVIVTKWTGYMMTLISPGIYVMIECRSSKIFRSMQYVSIWSGYAVCISAYEKTIKDILSIMNKSEEVESNDNFKGWRRSTLGTPSFKKIVKFK
ncbi:unnamed protein product [Rhizophagus irregularis]|uniref:Uncharacterized protein n=1 Tax=Rhizophagus irregularis TaxID=588596 RepID=A0A916EEA4_9GLOM|nr:unnamed protein product [Rhizophagus irregularis]